VKRARQEALAGRADAANVRIVTKAAMPWRSADVDRPVGDLGVDALDIETEDTQIGAAAVPPRCSAPPHRLGRRNADERQLGLWL
jgi:hypothetical protein